MRPCPPASSGARAGGLAVGRRDGTAGDARAARFPCGACGGQGNMPRRSRSSCVHLPETRLEATVCDQDAFDAMTEYQLKAGALSRRQFGALTVGAGVLSLLPAVAAAVEVIEAEVEVTTPDGA